MARKINGNPAIAYQQGFKDGLAEQIEYSYIANEIIDEIAYYNVIDDFVKTQKTQSGLIQAWFKEKKRVKDEFTKDEDQIGVAISKINGIRKNFKMPPIQWKEAK